VTADPTIADRPGPRVNQRERILDAALRLMSESGAAGTSMRQLAKACDINVAAIYHYFASKEALLAAVIEARRYGTRLATEVPEVDPAASPADRLRHVFGVMWSGAIEEEEIWRLLLGEGLRGEPSALPVGRSLLDVLRSGLGEWLRVAVPEVGDSAALAELVMGQMFSGFVEHFFDPAADLDAIAERCAVALTATALDRT